MASSTMAAALAASLPAAVPTNPAAAAPLIETIPKSWAKFVDSEAEIPLRQVQLDGLAVMKIMKHSRDSYPSAVTGILLGLDLDGTLEISITFPLPSSSDEDEKTSKTAAKYQQTMLRSLKEVHGDDNVVGFYQSSALGAFLSQSFLDTQAVHQRTLRHGGIAIVHDMSRTFRGNASLKAFRLSAAFTDAHRGRRFNAQSLIDRRLTFAGILEELPLQIHNTPLLDAFLLTLTHPTFSTAHNPQPNPTPSLISIPTPHIALPPAYPTLSLSSTSALTHNLSLVLDTLDDYSQEAGNLAYHARQIAREKGKADAYIAKRKEENAQRIKDNLTPLPEEDVTRLFKIPPEPSRLESMLLLGQIDGYSKKLEDITGSSLVKMYAAKVASD